MMNKEQTEKLIILSLSVIIFTIGLVSVYLYATGAYDPLQAMGNPIIALGLIVLTVMAVVMGGIGSIMSLLDFNDLRVDKKINE